MMLKNFISFQKIRNDVSIKKQDENDSYPLFVGIVKYFDSH